MDREQLTQDLLGLWLQRITTLEPDDDQLEVALYALRRALNEEVGTNPSC